ncbi:MAG: hypothetical protein JNK23_14680 [Opitutaceae bacterium]|nr:hypothetical protein [Opitutaceae bacterium]
MRLVYIITPLAGFALFAGYFIHWRDTRRQRSADEHHAAVKKADQDTRALFSGQNFVGRDGRAEALGDIARGAPKLLRYGRTAASERHFSEILFDRFNVRLDPLAGCIVNEPLVNFADAYNASIHQFLAQKFGPSALADAERDAVEAWQLARAKK